MQPESGLPIFVCLLRIIETPQLQTPQGLCGVGQSPASLCWKIFVSENKSRKVPITVFKYHTFPSQGNPKSISRNAIEREGDKQMRYYGKHMNIDNETEWSWPSNRWANEQTEAEAYGKQHSADICRYLMGPCTGPARPSASKLLAFAFLALPLLEILWPIHPSTRALPENHRIAIENLHLFILSFLSTWIPAKNGGKPQQFNHRQKSLILSANVLQLIARHLECNLPCWRRIHPQ